MAFSVMWKESDEYQERYHFMYNELSKPDK